MPIAAVHLDGQQTVQIKGHYIKVNWEYLFTNERYNLMKLIVPFSLCVLLCVHCVLCSVFFIIFVYLFAIDIDVEDEARSVQSQKYSLYVEYTHNMHILRINDTNKNVWIVRVCVVMHEHKCKCGKSRKGNQTFFCRNLIANFKRFRCMRSPCSNIGPDKLVGS